MISEVTHMWPILSVKTVVEVGPEDAQEKDKDKRGKGSSSSSKNTSSSSLSPMRGRTLNSSISSVNSSASSRRDGGMASTSPVPASSKWTRGRPKRRGSVDIHSALGKGDAGK